MDQVEARLVDPPAELPDGDWTLYKENNWHLIALLGFGLYYVYGLNMYKSLNTVRDFQKGGNMCELDTNRILEHLLVYILFPVVLVRLWTAFKYRDHERTEAIDFKEHYIYVQIFWHGTFGTWTLFNMAKYMAIPKGCKESRCMSLVNYELALLIGCWSAVTVMFYTVIIIILIPVALYIMYKRHRARTA